MSNTFSDFFPLNEKHIFNMNTEETQFENKEP